ncbi:MAG: GFA family protein [Pseudomonadota bacterium]
MTCSCVCGAVRFEAEVIPGAVFNCHCERCRKSHGAAFATQAFAVRSSLRFLSGEDRLKEYRSTGGIRTFCGDCGSRLMNYAADSGDYLSIALGAADDPGDVAPHANAFLASAVPWNTPPAGLRDFDGLPDGVD